MTTEAAPVGRRERTRLALLEAGRQLITSKGVAGLRIQEITGTAGVALGSFYNHFESKEALVDAIVAESLGVLAEGLAQPADEDADAAELTAIACRRFVGLASSDPDLAMLVVHLDHADALFAGAVAPPTRRVVELGIAQGRFDVPDLEVAVVTVLGGALAVIRAIVAGLIPPSAADAFAESTLRSLGVPDRRAATIVRRPLPEQD